MSRTTTIPGSTCAVSGTCTTVATRASDGSAAYHAKPIRPTIAPPTPPINSTSCELGRIAISTPPSAVAAS